MPRDGSDELAVTDELHVDYELEVSLAKGVGEGESHAVQLPAFVQELREAFLEHGAIVSSSGHPEYGEVVRRCGNGRVAESEPDLRRSVTAITLKL